MRNFITVKAFTDKYRLETNAVYARKAKGYLPHHIFKMKMIDENFFLRREKFREKASEISYYNYVFLTEFYTQTAIAEKLHDLDNTTSVGTWKTFLCTGITAQNCFSFLSYKTKKSLYKFYRYSSWLVRDEKKKVLRLKKL